MLPAAAALGLLFIIEFFIYKYKKWNGFFKHIGLPCFKRNFISVSYDNSWKYNIFTCWLGAMLTLCSSERN